MALEEDLSAFMEDHGLPCTAGGPNVFLGILDQPDDGVSVGGKAMTSTMYALTVLTTDVAARGLKYGVAVTVDGRAFTVRESLSLDDGTFTQLTLTKT